MSDIVLPPSGGWIIIKRRLPAGLPQVPIFSIFYAVPDRVFIAGSHTHMPWQLHGGGLKEAEISMLYTARHTRRELMDSEKRAIEKLEEQHGNPSLEMRVKILAPDGEVCVNPYEWVPCGSIEPFLKEVGRGVTMHEYGRTAVPKAFQERLFYMRQRHIPQADALMMLVGEVRKMNVFWLEVDQEFTRVFDRDAA